MTDSRTHLRLQIRQRRQSLSAFEQQTASQQLIHTFSSLPEVTAAQRIALYLANDGELNTQPLIEWLWQQGKQVYLPVLHPFAKGHLLFLHYHTHTPMNKNRYGIAEPKLDQRSICPVRELDIIGTPLVAFDQSGQRLGMGGGYYDRTLAPWFKTQQGAMPIGLAHDCQQVEQLPTASWDIPLRKIVTPSKVWQW
ncbi:5-formyltetrahydrofolate cyclo-ligase [Vibrio cholerae]|uniref:5-formyltetrahydrofolate cyclo-ligase n=1 Tax=Vibrio cholerae TaxID=666 RepID=UPI00289130FE|nr:5-formyltetrahydrofolate cyclo-ligase [Vibrio cholerae]EKF9487589.1 5-formyltetrahydrofolate cyclo-ligase [Vibrio cholerae]ELH5151676.1 5-formyltetrahydrofolate cyclo-ligase [Vibrio cholerae]HEJ2455106.1 5-formyltetrahydrofolate cyclo-ligase [Vibrio cholerae]